MYNSKELITTYHGVPVNFAISASNLYEDNYISISESTSDLDMDIIFQEMAKRFNQIPIIEHKCHNCGARVNMDADNHIFICEYCGSAYAVGTAQING